MTPDLEARVRYEQVEVLYRQGRVVFLPNLIAGPAVVYALWSDIPHGVLLGWLACLYAVTVARSVLVWVHATRLRSLEENRRWGWYLAVANAGVMWGAAGFLFIGVAEPLEQAFIIVTIAAMTAGAVSSLSAFFPAYLMFAIPCVGAVIVRTLMEWRLDPVGQGKTYLLLGILSMVYLLVHLVFARNTSNTLAESIRLRFEKLDLVAELTVQKERAEAANVAKSKFLAAASHDLRQPMHALGLFIDALRSEPHAAKTARIVESVMESHQSATGLLDNLLEFSKVDAGTTDPALGNFPVQQLLDQVRAEFTVQASAADLELHIRPCQAFLYSDPVLLARMLGNLVSNAIRYTEEGRVLVGCRRAKGALRIEVHDTGIGIPREEHEAIFREFYQADGPRRRGKGIGMGLGLAIVSGLAQALDHPVTVRSTPGRGSSFAIVVPLGRSVAAQASTPQPLGDELRGRTVLVIDDEDTIREAVAEVLRRWGCQSIVAATAAEAANILATRRAQPDAMIVDYQLGSESGLDAIATVERALGRKVPAIIVTGDTHPQRLREASEIGYPLLYKPLAPMRLRAALTAALQASPRPAASSARAPTPA